jgi:PKHD-type hydroxylase
VFLHVPKLLDPAGLPTLLGGLCDDGFEPGAHTAGALARRVKRNLQLRRDAAPFAAIEEAVARGLFGTELVQRFALPRAVCGFLIARYDADSQYGTHVDDALMASPDGSCRTDLATTVFLSAPDSYDGGELVLESIAGTARIKLAAGDAVLYPATKLHRVEPVTAGTRLVAVAWIQSHVRDAAQRELLFDLALARRRIEASAPDSEEALRLAKVYSNLIRMWADA